MSEGGFEPGVIVSTRYRIEEELGRGGASVVFRATDIRHGRSVALKVLHPDLASENSAERFLQEIRIEAHLQHPNIVPLHDSGVWHERLFCVMALIEGETLRDRLRREGALPIEDAIGIACEVADALDYAHRSGVVHRDVKPENVLLHEGHAVLADFGISRALEAGLRGTDTLTTPGITLGTPTYMSPEQAGGVESPDGRSDIYSLGCLVYEMLTGAPPFGAATPRAMLAQHLAAAPTPMGTLRHRVPPHVEATVARMLEKNPADRFQQAAEVAEALRGERPVPRRRRRVHWVSRGKLAAAVVAGVIVVAIAAALRPGPATLDPNKVVVYPLEERGLRDDESGAGVDAALMVSTALEYAAPLKALDGVRYLAADGSGGLVSPDPEASRALAEELGAGFFIEGGIRRDPDSLRIVLVLRDTRGDSLVARRSAGGATGEATLASVTLAAVRGLLPELIDPGQAARLDIEALGAHHPSAVALWIQGERAYRSFRMAEASDFFERALEADSTLIFAAARGAQAFGWEHDHESARQMVARAVPHSETLPAKYAAYVRGLDAYLRGAAREAETYLQGALEIDPDWPEAEAALGEVYYHLQPRAMNLDSLAELHFRRATEADSAYIITRLHLGQIAARKGNLDELDEHIRVLAAHGSDEEVLAELRLMRECVRGDIDEGGWREAVARNDLTALNAAKSLGEGAWQPQCAVDGMRALLASEDAAENIREGALWVLQGLYVSMGDPESARALLDSTLAVDAQNWNQFFFVINTVAGAPMEDGAAQMDSLLRAPDGHYYADLSSTPRWVLGIWNAYLGDTLAAGQLRDSLAASYEAGSCEHCGSLAAAVGAHILLAAGNEEAALAAYDTIFPAAPLERLTWRFAEPLAVTRIRQAELHASRSEHFEAIRAASVLDGRPAVFLPFLARSLEIRYRASLAWGDQRMADGYRQRLERLGRHDLLDEAGGDPPANPREDR